MINPIVLQEAIFLKLSALFADAFAEQHLKSAGYKSLVTGKLIEIIITLFRIQHTYKRPVNAKPEKWDIDDVVHYIDINYTENFTLHEMAGRCGLNPSYFSRRFKNRTGVSLFEYLNRIRILSLIHI